MLANVVITSLFQFYMSRTAYYSVHSVVILRVLKTQLFGTILILRNTKLKEKPVASIKCYYEIVKKYCKQGGAIPSIAAFFLALVEIA